MPVLLHAFATWRDWFKDPVAIALAAGEAHNEIIPDQPVTIDISHAVAQLAGLGENPDMESRDESTEDAAERRDRLDNAGFMEDPRSLRRVIAYLGRAGESPKTIEALNQQLKRAGYSIRIAEESREGAGSAEGGEDDTPR